MENFGKTAVFPGGFGFRVKLSECIVMIPYTWPLFGNSLTQPCLMD